MVAVAATGIGTLIHSTPGVNGGRPCLAGTGLSVMQIAVLYNGGMSPAEILADYPHLDLTRIYAGITYYLANRPALDDAISREARGFAEAAARQPV